MIGMPYAVIISRPVQKQLDKLPADVIRDVYRVLRDLENDPRPDGVKLLKGKLRGFYRVRVGNYRIVYDIKDRELRVIVLRVADRSIVYR